MTFNKPSAHMDVVQVLNYFVALTHTYKKNISCVFFGSSEPIQSEALFRQQSDIRAMNNLTSSPSFSPSIECPFALTGYDSKARHKKSQLRFPLLLYVTA